MLTPQDYEAAANISKSIGRTAGAESSQTEDARLNRVEFMWEYKIDQEAVLAGKNFDDCFNKKLFMKVVTPGTKDVAYLPATRTDKVLYARAYEAFERKDAMEGDGTPLHLVKQFKPAIAECQFFDVYTIEALADLCVTEEINQRSSLPTYKLLAQRWCEKMQRCGECSKVEETPSQTIKKRGRPVKAAEHDDD